MWCDEVEGERGWEEEGMMKSSSGKTTWRLCSRLAS